MGWPLPVLEQKQMWWDWDDPALKGPEPDPRLQLLPLGLIVNPLIVGSSLFVLLAGAWVLLVGMRRMRWRAEARCTNCGYPIRTPSTRCAECGHLLATPTGHPFSRPSGTN
jgi:hypothetical protein